MGKIISTLALVIMIVLFPPAALITVSQDAASGDFMYPVKRVLEDGVLFLASFNTTTKAYFAVAQANRRYEESAKLLSMGHDAGRTLQELVTQSNVAALDINKISSTSQKARLITSLSNSIIKYDEGLAKAQQQIPKTDVSKPSPTQTSQPALEAPVTTSAPQPQTSAKPAVSSTTSSTQPTPQATHQPTFTPSPKPTPSPANNEAKKQQEAIEKARRELEELRKRLEEEQKKLQQEKNPQESSQKQPDDQKRGDDPVSTQIPSPSPTPSPSKTPVLTSTPSPSASSKQSRKSRKKEKSESKSQGDDKKGNKDGEDD